MPGRLDFFVSHIIRLLFTFLLISILVQTEAMYQLEKLQNMKMNSQCPSL